VAPAVAYWLYSTHHQAGSPRCRDPRNPAS